VRYVRIGISEYIVGTRRLSFHYGDAVRVGADARLAIARFYRAGPDKPWTEFDLDDGDHLVHVVISVREWEAGRDVDEITENDELPAGLRFVE